MKATTLHPMEVAKRVGTGSGGGGGDIEERVEILEEKIAAYAEYSTDEVDTGKEWIDGKRIYRRVITKTNTDSENSFVISEAETIISVEAFSRLNDATPYSKLPYWKASDRHGEVEITGNTVNILLASYSWGQYGDIYMTVEYTKTE